MSVDSQYVQSWETAAEQGRKALRKQFSRRRRLIAWIKRGMRPERTPLEAKVYELRVKAGKLERRLVPVTRSQSNQEAKTQAVEPNLGRNATNRYRPRLREPRILEPKSSQPSTPT